MPSMHLPIVMLILALLAFSAHSQCATGLGTGGGNCIPPDASGMPGYVPTEGNAPAPLPAIWADSWGSIVLDAKGGAKGISTNQANMNDAIQSAMAKCRATGAANCKVELTYYNQCAAVAWGDQTFGIASNPTIEGASHAAVASCSESGTGCRTVYTACSQARRVQ